MKIKSAKFEADGSLEPVLVELTEQDKLNIKNMGPEATKYYCYPEDWDRLEIENFIGVADHPVWSTYYNEDDNTCYETPSPYQDDGEVFYYRIEPELREDRIIWVDRSTGEISSCCEYLSLEDAKEDMNQRVMEDRDAVKKEEEYYAGFGKGKE